MKYYVKLALITLLVSVAAAEILGPLVGMRGYIGPAIMSLFATNTSRSSEPENTAQLEFAETDSNTAEDSTTASSSAQIITAEGALDRCVSALKSVSLHPDFTQVPAVSPQSGNAVFTFDWPKATPTRVMDTSGNEQNLTAACRIGEDGRFRTLIVDGRELFNDISGSETVIKGWRIGRSISKIDRSTNVTVSTHATRPAVINGENILPILVLHCGENKTVSYIKLGSNVGSGKVSVTTAIDDDEQTLRWTISADGNSIYRGGKYISLLRQLLGSSLYTVNFAPKGQEAVSIDFPLDGIKAAINPLQEACHWR